MYFDQVFTSRGECIFNGTPEEVRVFLLMNDLTDRSGCYVIQGSTAHEYSIGAYLAS